jgi:hypothetical protein
LLSEDNVDSVETVLELFVGDALAGDEPPDWLAEKMDGCVLLPDRLGGLRERFGILVSCSWSRRTLLFHSWLMSDILVPVLKSRKIDDVDLSSQ